MKRGRWKFLCFIAAVQPFALLLRFIASCNLSHCLECRIQCRNQIFRLFNADGEPDRVFFDALLSQFLRRALAVGRGGRMDHKGFHVRHVCQQGKDRQIVDKSLCR